MFLLDVENIIYLVEGDYLRSEIFLKDDDDVDVDDDTVCTDLQDFSKCFFPIEEIIIFLNFINFNI